VPSEKHCVACQRGPDETPLLELEFQGGVFHICAQHLPVLIHDPAQLVGRLAGAESLTPADHED
jgi:hypothetical protein